MNLSTNEKSLKFKSKYLNKYGENNTQLHLETYVNSVTKMKFTCLKHDHIYFQTPGNCLYGFVGCSFCSQELKLFPTKHTKETLLNKFKEVHGEKYIYDNYNFDLYVNYQSKILITCKIHGDFEQESNSHIQGSGCPLCKALNIKSGGLNLKNFDSEITFYCILLNHKDFNTIKIGVTSQELKYRLKRFTGCTKEVLFSIKLKANLAINLEKYLLINFVQYKQTFPKKSFKGSTECFKIEYKDLILQGIHETLRTSDEKTLEANTN